MDFSVQITSRHVALTDDTTDLINRRARALAQMRPDILRCEVTVDVPHRSRRKGRKFRVGVSVFTPDEVISSNHHPGAEREDENLGVAINHAFRTLRRQLSDRSQLRPGCHTRSHRRRNRAHDRRLQQELRWFGAEEELQSA